MNKLTIVLLLAGLALSEAGGLIYFFWPQTAQIEYNLFLSNCFDEKITVLWYVYELMNILNHVIWAFVLANIAGKISYTLFKTAIVFFFYYVIQFGFYMWDRNTSFLRNYIVYACMISILIILLSPEKATGKYKRMEQNHF